MGKITKIYSKHKTVKHWRAHLGIFCQNAAFHFSKGTSQTKEYCSSTYIYIGIGKQLHFDQLRVTAEQG